MSLKLLLSLFPAALLLLSGFPSVAQIQDGMEAPSVEEGIPDGSTGIEPAPIEPETDASMEPEITPDTATEPSTTAIGGAGPTGPLTLVECGPSGAASVVTKIPAGCRILSVNSPPGQLTNAETP